MTQATDTAREVTVTLKDLPLSCPLPGAPLWARHPRVFFDVVDSGEARCPYCGTRYRYSGEKPHDHH